MLAVPFIFQILINTQNLHVPINSACHETITKYHDNSKALQAAPRPHLCITESVPSVHICSTTSGVSVLLKKSSQGGAEHNVSSKSQHGPLPNFA